MSYQSDNANVKVVPNVVIIKFKERINNAANRSRSGVASVDGVLRSFEITALEPLIRGKRILNPAMKRLENIYFAHYGKNISPEIAAKELSKNPDIEYAEPQYIQMIEDVPNDTLFEQQNFLQVINAPPAWDIVKSESSNVVIAIVDGGTDIHHVDLAANLWVNPGEIADNGIDDDNNGLIDDVHGWNFADSTNDPTGLSNTPANANHGTHTAGLACAVTNNKIGVAGVSWNAKLMAINVSNPAVDRELKNAYVGMFYAVEMGADIISCSWGALGVSSQFEQDVINTVTDMGTAVVAAAGNNNKSAPHYPSAYNNVLSVAAIDNAGQKADFSNYGSTIDVAAPGVSLLSTLKNSNYGTMRGTSMACPVAAGIVALVKAQHPDWRGIQAAEQVRVTADNIDSQNSAYIGQLGKGRVNAFSAVTKSLPSIKIARFSFKDANDDGIIEQGESVDVFLTFTNFLSPAENVNLELQTDDGFVTLGTRQAGIGFIGMMDTVAISTPFRFTVKGNAPNGHPVLFKVLISSGDYQEQDEFTLIIAPTFGDVHINNIASTVTSIGRIGFADNGQNDVRVGTGFKFKDGPNLLFEGALISGTGPDQISDAARGVKINNALQYDRDFTKVGDQDFEIRTPGHLSDQESYAVFEDTNADNPMNIRITQETFAFNNPSDDDFILFRYTVENLKTTPLDNFYLGLFFDWDMDGETFNTNMADYDSVRQMGYAYDSDGGPDTYVGISVLSQGNVSYHAIFNDENAADNPSWGLYDGFTDEEKWQTISGGLEFLTAGPGDISHVIGTGPFTIDGEANLELGFALLAGDNLTDLQANADSAKKIWEQLLSTGVDDRGKPTQPGAFALQQNYPNPFNPLTTISYQIPQNDFVELKIYNTLGQMVRTLVDKKQTAGNYSVQWNGLDENGRQVTSGTFLVKLQAGDFSQVRKMVYLK
ncbi:MAG: S8 family serine peptidase [Actinobacteria bacterium]|nr:S8 family serine peptidase [Actinomycetota bacterium]